MILEKLLKAKHIREWDKSKNRQLEKIATISHPFWYDNSNISFSEIPKKMLEIFLNRPNKNPNRKPLPLTSNRIDILRMMGLACYYPDFSYNGYSNARRVVFERYFMKRIQELSIPLIYTVPENIDIMPERYATDLNKYTLNDNVYYIPTKGTVSGKMGIITKISLVGFLDGFEGEIICAGGKLNACALALHRQISKKNPNLIMMGAFLFSKDMDCELNGKVYDDDITEVYRNLFPPDKRVENAFEFFRNHRLEKEYMNIVMPIVTDHASEFAQAMIINDYTINL